MGVRETTATGKLGLILIADGAVADLAQGAQEGRDMMAQDQKQRPSSQAAKEEHTGGSVPETPAQKRDDETQKSLERPTAEQIYKQVARNAYEELKRSSVSLFISGVTGGMFMGLSALGVGIIIATLGVTPATFIVSRMFYPLGFIVVILGRSQLFTENTLYPVALVLAEKKELWNTLRLWAIVLPSNILGAMLFAALISLTHALPWPVLQAIGQLGVDAVHVTPGGIFWSAVMGGWIIATTAWLVSGSSSITGSVLVIWMLTFVVGLGSFAHCIATSGEVLAAVMTHRLVWTAYPHWLGLAVAGNVCGGVLMVTLLEYGQAIYGTSLAEETESVLKPEDSGEQEA